MSSSVQESRFAGAYRDKTLGEDEVVRLVRDGGTVYTNGGTSGTLYIGHDGTMEAFSSASCGSGNAAQCYTSLATVSYPINS